ncbi:MAG: DedA family protein, partial [Candidatus Paceibacterota bacterium]
LIVGFLAIDSLVYYLALRGHKIITFLLHKVLDIDIDKEDSFLRKHAIKIIFISRFLVQLRALGPITAARVGVPFKKFLQIDFLALVVYVPLVLGLGYYFAHSLEKVLSGSRALNNVIFSGLIVIGCIIGMRRLRKILLSEFGTKTVSKIKSSMKL